MSITDKLFIGGFFSEYLPKCFTFDERLLEEAVRNNCDDVAPLSYTMSRFDSENSRRIISIPEIGGYLSVHKYCINNNIIEELDTVISENQVTLSKFIENEEIISHSEIYDSSEDSESYINNIILKLKKSKGSKRIVKLDISNCYNSFYLHMIPTIALGKDNAVMLYNNSTDENISLPQREKYRIYNELDKRTRNLNQKRTNGLLVGLDYSRLLVEALLSRIDEELIQSDLKYVRFVDDYEVFVNEESIEEIISKFNKTLSNYGFTLNYSKTKVVEYPFYVEENLQAIIDQYSSENLDESTTFELFNTFYNLEEKHIGGAVSYLVKSLNQINFNSGTEELLNTYLINIIQNTPKLLDKAAMILVEKCVISNADADLLTKMLERHIGLSHDLEAIWLTYILIVHGFSNWLNFEMIINSNNELLKLLCLNSNLLTEEMQNTLIQQNNSWLLSYELYNQDLITEEQFRSDTNITRNISLYNTMRYKDITFCKPVTVRESIEINQVLDFNV